jgi:hypothetical protein
MRSEHVLVAIWKLWESIKDPKYLGMINNAKDETQVHTVVRVHFSPNLALSAQYNDGQRTSYRHSDPPPRE